MTRLLFIFLMSIFSFAYSDTTNLSKISYPPALMKIEAVDTSDKTTIFLNNRTAWKAEDDELFKGPYGWRVGDHIQIVYVYAEGYYLQNVSSPGCVPVKLQNMSSPDIKANVIKEIIFNEKKETNTLVLDNGSKWFIGAWSSAWMKNWQVGDRILATPQEFLFGNADYLLLNLDQGKKNTLENVRAQLLHSSESLNYEDHNKRDYRNWSTHIVSLSQEGDFFILELNNKTLWKCSQPKLDWQSGDVVQCALDLDKECELLNLRNSEKINASIANSHSKAIDLPYVKEISKNGERIVLNDLSVWFTKKEGFKKWHKNDRIMISPLDHLTIDTSSHLLINIDVANEHKSATLIK